MNSTIYLFGKFGQSITASVDDYTKSFFEEFISKANAPTQIIIHRDGDIMNYGYVRKIENDYLFGVCVQINGQYLSTTKRLFDVFENVIANIVVRGDILCLNRNGNLEVKISSFMDNQDSIERVISNCHNEFDRLSSTCRTLPDIDFSTSDTDVNYFKESDNSNTIIKSSVKNGYTFIYKEQDYDTLALGGYRNTLSILNKENETYKKKIYEQDKKLKLLEREKKQMGVVVALFVILFIGSIIFFNTIAQKNEDIERSKKTIDKQKNENTTLTRENEEIQNANKYLENRNHDLVVKQESINQELKTLKHENERLRNDSITFKQEIITLKQQNNNHKTEINSLTNKISTIEKKLKKTEADLASKNTAYITLQNKYDRINSQLTTMKNKYYSTKEGKRELKK